MPAMQGRASVWVAAILWTGLTIAIEFATPTDYVLGYLYVGPVWLVGAWLSRRALSIATLSAVTLVLLNLWVPWPASVSSSALTNRLLAALSLIVTASLSDQNRRVQAALAQQQAQFAAQGQLSQLREDVAATLTHDLKTPLLGAIATLEAWQEGRLGPMTVQQQRALEIMTRSHHNSLRLLEMMLEVYHNDGEGLQLDHQPVELGELCDRAIRPLRDLANNRQVTVRLERGEAGFWANFWVDADALQLERAIGNLLLNAFNHAPRGSQVLVQVRAMGDCCRVEVTDAGPGIPAESMLNLFERFYQAGSDRQLTGSGLGLYLSRQIVEAHGGRIWAENRSPQGATFVIELAARPQPIAP